MGRRDGRIAPLAGILLAAVVGLGAAAALQVEPRRRLPEPPPGGGPDIGLMLMEGLKATPGCLGTDLGQMQSGRNVIVAWFENAEAARRWYESPVHRSMVSMAGRTQGRALEHAPEDVPLMVVASITPTREASAVPGYPMPISQLAIEVFAAVPGGVAINGRLSPEGFEVPHLRRLEPAPVSAP